MPAVWYFLLSLMLVTYVVLDGFDFGAGMLHLFVARTDEERRTVIRAIGPVWDGNEVWLLASGGVLVFAFPRVYAAGFSGLYLPLMIVLWLLIARGVAIEFRSLVDNPLWRSGFDALFWTASLVMAIVLGVALGNVVRGVPIDSAGWFHEDLFTDFRPRGEELGAIDAYTTLVGIFSAITLAAHGANYLAWRTDGEVNLRSRRMGTVLLPAMVALGIGVTAATAYTQPEHLATFAHRPYLWPLPALALAAGVLSWRASATGHEARAFVLSSAFMALLLVVTASTLFPVLLRSTIDPHNSLDAWSASSARATLGIGLWAWIPAMLLAALYFVVLYRSFRGKVTAGTGDYH